MKNRRIIIVAVLLLCSWANFTYAQETCIECKILNKEAMDLFRQGNFTQGIVVAGRAVEVAEQNAGPDHYVVADSLNTLGLFYVSRGDYDKAGSILKRAMAIRKKTMSEENYVTAYGLKRLAKLYRAMDRPRMAETLEQRAMAR